MLNNLCPKLQYFVGVERKVLVECHVYCFFAYLFVMVIYMVLCTLLNHYQYTLVSKYLLYLFSFFFSKLLIFTKYKYSIKVASPKAVVFEIDRTKFHLRFPRTAHMTLKELYMKKMDAYEKRLSAAVQTKFQGYNHLKPNHSIKIIHVLEFMILMQHLSVLILLLVVASETLSEPIHLLIP